MIIRKMCERDLSAVCDLERLIFTRPWSEKDFQDSISKDNNIYLVAEEQGGIVGYCGLWEVAGEGQINNVAVTESHRGQGIAEEMLAALLDMGRKQGIEAFTLEVRVSNLPAVSLYHRMGFRDSGLRRNFYEAPTEDAVIMWL